MDIQREHVRFRNGQGQTLDARLERPAGGERAVALFAHCFTCSKDIAAASRISSALAQRGIAVLRFDFTGLGNSEGDFANTNFSSNVEDLVAAANHLRDHVEAPALLIGHSLGGAAVIPAALQIPEASGVITIGAPSSPDHVQHLFAASVEEIEEDGEAEVDLAGRPFTIRRQFLDDLRSRKILGDVARLHKAILILHSPVDNTVSVEHARALYEAARHPKSFISLDQADHLLSKKEDSVYVAELIAAWAARYLSGNAVSR